MKAIWIPAFLFIFQSCEFVNDPKAKSNLDGSFAYSTDSTKTIWEFKGGQDFFERITYKCDTLEMKAQFVLVDSTLTLSGVQVRIPKTNACPMEFTPWDEIGSIEYKVMLSKDKLFVLTCKSGRCREPTVRIEFIKIFGILATD